MMSDVGAFVFMNIPIYLNNAEIYKYIDIFYIINGGRNMTAVVELPIFVLGLNADII